MLRKTDFFAVSVRKNAFLSSAPEVAGYVDAVALIEQKQITSRIDIWNIGFASSTTSLVFPLGTGIQPCECLLPSP